MPAFYASRTIGALVGRARGSPTGLLLVHPGPTHFGSVAEVCVVRDVDIHIERTFGLGETPRALAHGGHGRALGKVGVEVA